MHMHMPTYIIQTYTDIDTQERTHMHVHRACLRAQGNAPAISGSLPGDSHLRIPAVCLLVDSEQKMNTLKTTTKPFLGSDRVPPTSGRQTSVFLLFDSEQKTNTKKTTPRPFLGSDRVPPTAGGQTDKCCTFLNHMEMHACAHAYAHAHVHTYIFTPTSTHEMRTRTCTHIACAHTQTQLLF